MRRLYSLLQQLTATRRREFLRFTFSEMERLALETWIVSWKAQRSPPKPCAELRVQGSSSTGSEQSGRGESVVENSEVDSEVDGLVVLSRSESEGESEMLALGDDDVLARTAHEDLRGCETYDLDGFRESDEETLDHAMGPCALAFPLRYEPEVHSDRHLAAEGSSILAPVDAGLQTKATGKSGVRGLIKQQFHSSTLFYAAVVNVQNMRIGSRFTQDLAAALDFLVVVTAIRQRVISQVNSGRGFGESLTQSVPVVLSEQGTTVSELGLWFRVEAQISCWLRRPVVTPLFRDVELAFAAWQRLAPYRWTAGLRVDLALDMWMHKLFFEWPAFRRHFLDILEESGRCRIEWAARLEDWWLEDTPRREKNIELWNLQRMRAAETEQRMPELLEAARNEKWNRREMLSEERRQLYVQKQERTWQLRCLQAMRSEERRQRRVLRWESRAQRRCQRAMLHWDRWSSAWNRHSERNEQREVSLVLQELKRWRQEVSKQMAEEEHRSRRVVAAQRSAARRALRRQLLAKASAKRVEGQRQRAAKDARWKWMNRPGLTMDDMMGVTPGSTARTSSGKDEARVS